MKAKADHPILYRADMIRAYLENRKSQTRRPLREQPIEKPDFFITPLRIAAMCATKKRRDDVVTFPYGVIGGRIWARETWRCFGGREYEYQQAPGAIRYREDATLLEYVDCQWRPSIFMPRWASRITQTILDVRLQRIESITNADARAEGFTGRDAFKKYWNKMHPNKPWGSGLWVWAITFPKYEDEPCRSVSQRN
jgi:hypothetical protein